jgi:hypothetical protein
MVKILHARPKGDRPCVSRRTGLRIDVAQENSRAAALDALGALLPGLASCTIRRPLRRADCCAW